MSLQCYTMNTLQDCIFAAYFTGQDSDFAAYFTGQDLTSAVHGQLTKCVLPVKYTLPGCTHHHQKKPLNCLFTNNKELEAAKN